MKASECFVAVAGIWTGNLGGGRYSLVDASLNFEMHSDGGQLKGTFTKLELRSL